MNATEKQEASLREQLDALGIHIQEGDDDTLQVSNANEAKEDAKLLLPITRAWLGATVFRDLYSARQRNQKNHKIVLALEKYAIELSRPEALLNYTKIYVQRMCVRNGAQDEKLIQEALNFYNILKAKPEGWVMSKWALIRAINAAIRRSNYGNFMRNSKWIYTGDSDHKIIVVLMSGQYRWTEPEKFTFGTLDAETEEEYTRPYDLKDIPNPENKDESIKCRVYRKMGNVIHPSTNNEDTVALQELDPLITGLSKLEPGKVAYKEYDKELRHDEFERQAEADVDYVLDKAKELGVKIWPAIQNESRTVLLYHAGYAETPPFQLAQAN